MQGFEGNALSLAALAAALALVPVTTGNLLCIDRVWSAERHISGGRYFLACPYREFWEYYRALPAAERHHYEIIREGQPCHLYFGE